MEGPSENSLPSQPLLGRLTRRMIPQKLQKRKAQVAKKKVKVKHQGGVTPVRMTSCIFRMPVTRITSCPESKTKSRQKEEKLKKPRQLCALKTLNEHHVEVSEGELFCPLDLPDLGERIALRNQEEAKVQSGVNYLHNSSEFTSAQPPSSEKKVQGTFQVSASFSREGAAMMPVALPLSPSLYRQPVTTADIKRHSRRVVRARKKLAAALEADRLARQAENMGEWSKDEYSEN